MNEGSITAVTAIFVRALIFSAIVVIVVIVAIVIVIVVIVVIEL